MERWTVKYVGKRNYTFYATFGNIDTMLDSCVRAKAAGYKVKVTRWVSK